jgi:hypothetical protein
MLNPMHRLWSDGRWNKLTVAHGCYWKKCSFCDVSLDYISRYDAASAATLVDRIEAIVAETGQTGFHLVDEAAPPKSLKALAAELQRRQVQISWWGNIRFEKTFTPELCLQLADSGCIAISGGLEVASDRLLALMKKGVSVDQVARVTKGFADAGAALSRRTARAGTASTATTRQPPFFMALAGDSDLWAFVSSAGSLAAGPRDAEGAFLPYETVDKIHLRWEHTGPRSWIRFDRRAGPELWQPFAPRPAGAGRRSVWKNLSGTRIRFRELHPSGRLASSRVVHRRRSRPAAHARGCAIGGRSVAVQVLDGVLNLLPPGVGVKAGVHAEQPGRRLQVERNRGWRQAGTVHAVCADLGPGRAQGVLPCAGLACRVACRRPAPCCRRSRWASSAAAVRVQSESLTRGRRGAFLVQFDTK